MTLKPFTLFQTRVPQWGKQTWKMWRKERLTDDWKRFLFDNLLTQMIQKVLFSNVFMVVQLLCWSHVNTKHTCINLCYMYTGRFGTYPHSFNDVFQLGGEWVESLQPDMWWRPEDEKCRLQTEDQPGRGSHSGRQWMSGRQTDDWEGLQTKQMSGHVGGRGLDRGTVCCYCSQ